MLIPQTSLVQIWIGQVYVIIIVFISAEILGMGISKLIIRFKLILILSVTDHNSIYYRSLSSD